MTGNGQRSAAISADTRLCNIEVSHLHHRPHFFGLTARASAGVWLNVIACRDGVNAIAPYVWAKLSQGETRISLNQVFAKFGARLTPRSRAKIEVLNRPTDLRGKRTALVRLGSEEPRSKIHLVSTEKSCSAVSIDQNDVRLKRFALSNQIFLHVDQND